MSLSSSRRQFLQRLSLGLGAGLLTGPALADSLATSATSDAFGPASGEALRAGRKLGVALVGLGGYSRGQLAPALQKTQLCELRGIVTGSPTKVPEWKSKYGILDKNVYNYQNFDQIAHNPAIDIVYVVLPNALHAEYVVRAAKAGKHVICEKPMATSAADARRMIAACKQAGKQLSIGYRLHFEPHNREMMRLGQQQAFGPVQKLTSANGFTMGKDERPWRIQKKLSGGGPLMDMGIYSVQGVIYTVGEVPESVTAQYAQKTRPQQFNEVEEALSWQFRFPGGAVADCRSSYVENMSSLRADAVRGWFALDPAFGYGGLKGTTSQGPMNIANVPQQARQMDDFADCILNHKPTRVPGEMGLRDVQLLEAIYRAADTGRPVSTKDVQRTLDLVGKG